MITLVAATNNPHKLIEFREILGENYDIKSLNDLGLHVEVVEDADSFYGNAYKKAKAVCDACGQAALSDDSGLIVDALGGAPGVYSARYAGRDGDDAANRKKLLKEMAAVTDFNKRTARFHSSVVIVYPDGRSISGAGDTEGKILFEEKATAVSATIACSIRTIWGKVSAKPLRRRKIPSATGRALCSIC